MDDGTDNQPDRSLRVLLVVDTLEMGGAERHVVNLGTALNHKGHEVTIACSLAGVLAEPAEAAGLRVVSLLGRRVKRRFSLSFAREITRLLHESRYDLVHAHIYASAVASAFATLETSLPLVITEHSEAAWRTRRARWLSRLAYRRAAHVIAVSDRIHQRLVHQDGISPNKVSVILNAIPPRTLPANGSGPDPDLVLGGPVIGIVARLQPEKGVADFLRAASQIAPALPAARFVVVGDGPLRAELASLAEQLGLGTRVHFLGLRADAESLIAHFDVLVVSSVPSLSGEGTPLVILEALAAGVPVVATRVGGIPEQIQHEQNGLLVPPGQPEALWAAVLRLFQDPKRARQLGEAGRVRLASSFSFATMLEKTELVYRAALMRQGVPGEAPLK